MVTTFHNRRENEHCVEATAGSRGWGGETSVLWINGSDMDGGLKRSVTVLFSNFSLTGWLNNDKHTRLHSRPIYRLHCKSQTKAADHKRPAKTATRYELSQSAYMIMNSFHLKSRPSSGCLPLRWIVVEPLLCFKANSPPQTPLKRRWTRQSNSRPGLVSARSRILARNDSELVLGTISAVAVMDGRGACCQCGAERPERPAGSAVRASAGDASQSFCPKQRATTPPTSTHTHFLMKGSIIFVKSKALILPPCSVCPTNYHRANEQAGPQQLTVWLITDRAEPPVTEPLSWADFFTDLTSAF